MIEPKKRFSVYGYPVFGSMVPGYFHEFDDKMLAVNVAEVLIESGDMTHSFVIDNSTDDIIFEQTL